MPQIDPLAIMADTFLRLVAVEFVTVVVWAPFVCGAIYLHARLVKKGK